MGSCCYVPSVPYTKLHVAVPHPCFIHSGRGSGLYQHGWLMVMHELNPMPILLMPVAPSIINQEDYQKEALIQKLTEENEQLRDNLVCKICRSCDVSVLLVPCGHLICPTCMNAWAKKTCPFCNQVVENKLRFYVP